MTTTEHVSMGRRDFLRTAGFGTMGLVSLGMLNSAQAYAAEEAKEEKPAEEAPAAAAAETAAPAADDLAAREVKPGYPWMTVDEMNAFRRELIDSKEGETYTTADGTEVPNVFVKLRALINSYGLGLGSDMELGLSGDAGHHFDEILINFTEDEAQAYLEMPWSKWFTATDFAFESGRDEADCLEICEEMATKGLLMRARRAGVPYFHQLAEAHGIWEYNMFHYDLDYTTAHQISWSSDVIANLYNSETPFYYAIPCEKEVVADGSILPYDDYEAIIKRNTKLAVSPCQCRLRRQVMGDFTEQAGGVECDHPLETCISTGEEAEYYIENGIGREITQEEALEILKTNVEKGMVIQSAYTKATEVICSCHGDCCDILSSYVALGSEGAAAMNQFPQVSHYTLEHNEETCIKCGACVPQCPLYAITMDEETGFPTVGNQCVRCGQCGRVCPTGSRLLVQKPLEEIPPLPDTMLDDYNLKSSYRMAHGYVY